MASANQLRYGHPVSSCDLPEQFESHIWRFEMPRSAGISHAGAVKRHAPE